MAKKGKQSLEQKEKKKDKKAKGKPEKHGDGEKFLDVCEVQEGVKEERSAGNRKRGRKSAKAAVDERGQMGECSLSLNSVSQE